MISRSNIFKRVTGISVLSILLAFSFFGCDNATSPSSSGGIDKRAIVCLGDSLTEGYGASQQESYPAFLQKKIAVTVINAGVSGDTASGGLARVNSDVLAKDPQMVIVLLGGNDFLRVRPRPAAETKADLQAIINRIKGENRKVYLASFIGDAEWEKSYLNTIPILAVTSHAALLAEYRKIFSELASENKDIGYIPNIWMGIGSTDMSDPIHPNAEGYNKMAENIYTAIEPYLRDNGIKN